MRAEHRGDVIIVNNTNVHAGTVRAGTSQRVDFRVDYGQKGLTQTEPAERVGDMSAEESGDAAISWNYQKIPTRIAAAHPELVDTLPNPETSAKDLGLWGIATFIGASVGPLIGGPLLQFVGRAAVDATTGELRYGLPGYVALMVSGSCYVLGAALLLSKVTGVK